MGLVLDHACKEEMKKILYIHHGGELGGAPLSLFFLLSQIDKSIYQPILLFLADGDAVDLFRNSGYDCHVVDDIDDYSHTELVWYGKNFIWQLPRKTMRFISSVKSTHKYIQRFEPDIVHLNSSTLLACAQAAYEADVPIVWHIREPLSKGFFGLRRSWIRKRIYKYATRVVAISKNDSNQLIPSKRNKVIHNFVDFSIFDKTIDKNLVRDSLKIGHDLNVVTMLGGCSKPKGTLQFLEALPKVVDSFPNVCFLIAGPDPLLAYSSVFEKIVREVFRIDNYDKEVMQAAANYIESGHARFLGVRSDIPEIIAASDIVVFPSTVPHFARPVIEASAMAKPVIASNIGGPQELIISDETGVLVPPMRSDELAKAIVDLFSDKDRMNLMGQRGYEYARKNFDAYQNSNRTFALYDEILRV